MHETVLTPAGDTSHRMKALICRLLAALFFVPAALCAQELQFDSTVCDFGPRLQGTKLSHVFRFRNDSRDTVTIEDPKTSCTCTAAVLSDPIVVPGRRGSLLVEYLPLYGMLGETEKIVTLVLRTRQGTTRQVDLRVRADMQAEAHAQPVVLHCEMLQGDSCTMEFDLVSNTPDSLVVNVQTAAFMQYADTTDAEDFDPTHVTASPFIDYSLSTNGEPVPPGGRKVYKLTLRGHERARISGSIRIVMPHSDLRVAVTADVRRIRSPG